MISRHAPRRNLIAALLAVTSIGAFGLPAQAATEKARPPIAQSQVAAPPAPLAPAVRETWRRSLVLVPKPSKGCFTATYPSKTWTPVACGKAPVKPYPPRSGPRGQVVGNGVDYSANTVNATTAADGQFPTITGVTSESTVQPGAPSGTANQFSLQLNTQFFQTQACNGAGNPGQCKGWEQFVVSNDPSGSSFVFIQYWLIKYNTTCPAGWFTYAVGTDTYCYVNSVQATVYPTAVIGTLGQMALTGTAGAGASSDSVSLNVGGMVYAATGDNHFPDLNQRWETSEFNIFGDCCGASAVFNNGSTLTVQTAVNYGSTAAPNCAMQGFTGETNNLTLVGTPTSAAQQPWPSVTFNQSNASSPTPASCATANSWGDTHIVTFAGLAYDFQSAGQFLLLNSGAGLTVYANQVSGAPSWPNTSVNGSIMTQMGNISVVVPATGSSITVNGTPFVVASGQSRTFGSDVQVAHTGSGYTITDGSGNRVQADINSASPSYINVFVYPGQTLSPQATGALVGQTQTQTMTSKVSFAALHGTFGKAWAAKSGVFKANAMAFAPATKPFHAKDLSAAQRAHGMAVCKKAGVTNPNLLNSCVLDVTVIGNDHAADVFARIRPPKAVLAADR